MRLLAQILGSALARKRAQEELEEAIGFERLASGILASLFLARPGDEAGAIEQGLEDIGLFLGVQRVSLWERVPGRDEFRRTHLWRAAGVPVLPAVLDHPWISARLISGSVVRFTRDTELPPEAAADLPKFARARGAFDARRAVLRLQRGRRSALLCEHARGPRVARGPPARGEVAGRSVREPARAPVGRAPEAGRGGRGGAVARAPGAPGAGAHGGGDVGRARPRDHPAAGGDRELRAGGAPSHGGGLARPRAGGGPAGQGDRSGDARRRRRDAHARHGAAARARAEGDRRRARGRGMRRHGEDGLRAARHPHRAEARPARCRWSSSTRSISSR